MLIVVGLIIEVFAVISSSSSVANSLTNSLRPNKKNIDEIREKKLHLGHLRELPNKYNYSEQKRERIIKIARELEDEIRIDEYDFFADEERKIKSSYFWVFVFMIVGITFQVSGIIWQQIAFTSLLEQVNSEAKYLQEQIDWLQQRYLLSK